MELRNSRFRLRPVGDTWEGKQSPTLHTALNVLQLSREHAAAVPNEGREQGPQLAVTTTYSLAGIRRFTNNHHHVFQPLVVTRGTTTGKGPITTSSLGQMLYLRITTKAETLRELW